MSQGSYPLFVKRDLDGFFGLFVDNLVQLLLIVQLCALCGISAGSPLMLSYILPGRRSAFSSVTCFTRCRPISSRGPPDAATLRPSPSASIRPRC